MPDFAAALRDFVDTATTLEVLLAGVGFLALATAGIGWFLKMNHRADRTPAVRRGRKAARAGRGARDPYARATGGIPSYDQWAAENGIVFPPDGGGGGGDFRMRSIPIDPRDLGDEDDGPRGSGFGGFGEIGGGGARVVEAFRERPLEFLAGAIAAGFAAGLIVPLFSDRSRSTQLLERLVQVSEESRTPAQREAERFRQARPK